MAEQLVAALCVADSIHARIYIAYRYLSHQNYITKKLKITKSGLKDEVKVS